MMRQLHTQLNVNLRTQVKHLIHDRLPVRRRVYCQLLSKVLPIWVIIFISRDLSPPQVLLALSGPLREKCSVTRVQNRFGDRCFAAAGPRFWNNLPASLRDKEVSCTKFKRQLKTFVFQTDGSANSRNGRGA